MTGRLRIQYAGALYRVISRDNARHNIFRDDFDRKLFLDFLRTVTEDFCWLCDAYCLTANHYRLVIETPELNLSSG